MNVIWKSITLTASRSIFVALILFGVLGTALKMTSIADQFSRRVNDGGAIRTTSIVGVVVVFLATFAFSGVVHGRARYIFISTSAVTGSALVTLQLIAWARSDTTDRYGYYGQKLMYTANYIAWVLLIAMLGVFLAYLSEKSQDSSNTDATITRYFWFKTLGVCSFVALLTLSVVFLSTAKSPVVSIYRDWDSPSEEIVTRTFDNWKSGSEKYVFAFYATDSNDRLGNFWSPYFWEINRWEWTYSGYNVDAKSLCSVINGNEITLITSSQDLLRQMHGMCSPTLDKVTVEN